MASALLADVTREEVFAALENENEDYTAERLTYWWNVTFGKRTVVPVLWVVIDSYCRWESYVDQCGGSLPDACENLTDFSMYSS
jgi:hypothetical protein